MKRLALMLALCALALALAACGGKDAGKTSPDAQPAQQASVASAQAESAATEAPAPSDETASVTPASQAEADAPVESESPPAVAATDVSRPVDLDLTKISGTVVYSQVYDMMMEPEAYIGQKIRMRGSFGYYQDPETCQEYFATIIADATACCAQGIEFVWKGEHSYPRDYPPLDTEITVTGIFGTYYEGGNMFLQLTDADVSW